MKWYRVIFNIDELVGEFRKFAMELGEVEISSSQCGDTDEAMSQACDRFADLARSAASSCMLNEEEVYRN